MNQRELVIMAKKQDKDAFAKLYCLYKDKLYRYAYYKLSDENDAKDAVSETIVDAYQEICFLKKEDAFSGWIFKILNAKCAHYIKIRSADKKTLNIDDISNNIKSIDNKRLPIELKEALNMLKKIDQDIILLSVVGDLSSKEIARIVKITPSNVRVRLKRGLAKLKSYLE